VDRKGIGEDLLRYDVMVEQALRGVVREAIARVAQFGLPGGHSLYITFRTGSAGVEMADWLRMKYPETMTIVLENQFWDLAIADESFSVSLSFNGRRQSISAPFSAITAFHDPGAQFGLRLDRQGEQGEAAEGAQLPAAAAENVPSPDPPDAEPKSAEVVKLDTFRKK
jgi:hypothetical protein